MNSQKVSTRRRRRWLASAIAALMMPPALVGSVATAQVPPTKAALATAKQMTPAESVNGFIERGDIAGAVDAYRRYSVDERIPAAQKISLSSSRSRLVEIGIDESLLTLPPASVRTLPDASDAIPMTKSDSVPSGGSVTRPTNGSSPVTPAMFADGDGGVQQAGHRSPSSAGGSSNVAQVQFLEATNSGTESFDAGMKALSAGDKSEARKAFLEAWQNKDDLDVASQNILKDKLTLLQPRRLSDRPSVGQSDQPLTAMEKAKLEAQAATRSMYREVTSQLAAIEKIKTTEPIQAQENLAALQAKVAGSDIDPAARKALGVMVDRATTAQSKYVEGNRAKIELDVENQAVRTSMELEDSRRVQTDEKVKAMVEEYNDLMAQRRYAEATLVARQVVDLKPNDPIGTTMWHNSRFKTRLELAQDINDEKEESFVATLRDVEQSAVGIDPNFPMQFGDARNWADISALRLNERENDRNLSPAEREIKARLATLVNVNYSNRSLAEVLDDLSAVTDIPIVIDSNALSAVRVAPETPVTLQVNQSIRLSSALNLLLEGKDLTYIIRNDVLMVTSMEVKRNDVEVRTYKVTDLVTPIPNFVSGYEDGLAGALRAAYQMTMPQADVQLMPVSMTGLHGGMANHGASAGQMMNPVGNNKVMGQYHPMGSGNGFGGGGLNSGGQGAGGASFADFQSLIDLIQTTIEPDTWEALGGNSTMREYAQNLSLVISTTSDVHDQITNLLESLRRLQNLQITIEVRFITLSDTFGEQIGIDFDLQFDDNLTEIPEDDSGPSVSLGIGAGNAFTSNLDIQVNQDLGTAPPFGVVTSPTSLGFAILSDIEAFFFLQAAQTDTRSNVMQAPKVTLFDGQLATISDQSQRPFVTSITPVVGDFAVAQQPVIVVLNEGTQLNVQGVVSNDKRFVRLTLVPFFSQIGDVDTFTFEGTQTTTSNSTDQEDTNGDGVVNGADAVDTEDASTVITGTTVQLPTFAFTSVSTTVSVPDGGTILLGGIKRLSEGRNEVGVPVLSKIPYINRLFRNQATARTASSLMLMVTPRIIIQEEEELAQTGFDSNRR